MNNGAGSSVDPSDDSLFYASNFNVWNFGYAFGTPGAPAGNYAPDDPSNPNAYTSILRAQANTEGGMGLYANGNQNFVGFYTFAKDDYNANYQGNLQQLTITIGALASASTGSSGNDEVVGTRRNDVISGGYGADLLSGGATPPSGQQEPGRDAITRQPLGGSRQALPGRDGRDVFVYVRADSSLNTKHQRDVITDFDPSDQIDLAAVDACSLQAGQQRFSWIGQRQFNGTAGQLRIDVSPFRHALLQGDVDGNGKPDFEVKLLGVDLFARSNLLL